MTGDTRFSKGASADVQLEISNIIRDLNTLISDHESDTNSVMGENVIEGALETYASKDGNWNKAALEAKEIIDIIRAVMEENDEIAETALTRARGAAESI